MVSVPSPSWSMGGKRKERKGFQRRGGKGEGVYIFHLGRETGPKKCNAKVGKGKGGEGGPFFLRYLAKRKGGGGGGTTFHRKALLWWVAPKGGGGETLEGKERGRTRTTQKKRETYLRLLH